MSRVERLADGVELHLGDCREVLPTLGRFDACVTDIPYEISQDSGGLRELDYGTWDGVGASGIAVDTLHQCSSIPTVVAFCHWFQLGAIDKALPGRTTRAIAWVKTNPTVMNGEHVFLPAIDVAYYGKCPGAWFGGHCTRSVWVGPTTTDREHPTQKPLPLMRWVVVHTVPPGGSCIDPFMGSGTTGVACVKLGRKFTGIEIEPKYFDIACRRISEALRQPDLFIEPPAKAVQEAMSL